MDSPEEELSNYQINQYLQIIGCGDSDCSNDSGPSICTPLPESDLLLQHNLQGENISMVGHSSLEPHLKPEQSGKPTEENEETVVQADHDLIDEDVSFATHQQLVSDTKVLCTDHQASSHYSENQYCHTTVIHKTDHVKYSDKPENLQTDTIAKRLNFDQMHSTCCNIGGHQRPVIVNLDDENSASYFGTSATFTSADEDTDQSYHDSAYAFASPEQSSSELLSHFSVNEYDEEGFWDEGSHISDIPLTVEEVASTSTGRHSLPEERGGAKKMFDTKEPKMKTTDEPQPKKLWEFLLDSLASEETNPMVIKWTDRGKGMFQIIDANQLTELWTQSRKRQIVAKYEFLTRALRHYYGKKILHKVPGRRNTYQFGEKCEWQKYIVDCENQEKSHKK